MPLNVEISLINAIENEVFQFDDLATKDISWGIKPPEELTPFKYHRCHCTGPSSGFEIGLKYGGIICRIEVTAWGISYKKSVPTNYDLELVQVEEKQKARSLSEGQIQSKYRLEIILI
jgi:hypothetical protein